MTLPTDEAIEIARRLGRAYCRAKDVPPAQQEDCIQEGITAALSVLPKWNPASCQLATHLYPWVRGTIMAYRAKQRNGGMGGKDAPVRLVSLQDEVPGVHDFDDEPMTYEDVLSYDTPPRGYGDPLSELVREEDDPQVPAELLERLMEALSPADRALIKSYFGIDGPETTQQELAFDQDVSRQAINRRIKQIISRLAERASALGYKL